MEIPSRIVADAITQIARLPGIGKKTALRLVLYMLKRQSYVQDLAEALLRLIREVQHCKICGSVADQENCTICSNSHRDAETICVVEELPDLLAIEKTGHYNGRYHVLGGVISPLDGIGPEDLNLDSLMSRCEAGDIKEVILAIGTTMEGETTAFYILKKLEATGVAVSTIARGVPIGNALEYADEVTLTRSLAQRQPLRDE